MFSGPPLPLEDELPLLELARLTSGLARAGAWVRNRPRDTFLRLTSHGWSCWLLVSKDLGRLLRHCRSIVLREGARPILLDAELVIQWRTLQVVTSTPYLPALDHLRDRFPGLRLTGAGLSVPIRGCSPEAVLAECLAWGIEVSGSRIVYLSSFCKSEPAAAELASRAGGLYCP
jgi:hypothetical protein